MVGLRSDYVKQDKNKFNARFIINYRNLKTDGKPKRSYHHSDTYVVGGLLTIQFHIDLNFSSEGYLQGGSRANKFQGCIWLHFNKCFQDDTMEYVIQISSPQQLKISDTYMSCKSLMGCPILLYTDFRSSFKPLEFSFGIHFVFNVKKAPKFSSLHDDKDSTDIELVGDDGSMALHRSVLTCHSPVMETMLTGEWKENKEGRINAPGMSIQALEHLKNYLYLDDLPDTNSELEPLLDFACRYMMTDLVQKCSTKLLFSITAENAVHYVELAMKYKLKKLLFGILKMIQEGNFNLQLIMSSYCQDGWM